MIKKKVLYNILCCLILFLSLLSYEIHFYKYYSFLQITILGICCLLIMIVLKYDKDINRGIYHMLRKNKIIIFMFLFMILNTTISYFGEFSKITSLINVIGMAIAGITFFSVIPLLDDKYKNIKNNIFKLFHIFCLVLILMGLIIYFKKSFFGYSTIYGRAASIYYDSNFLAMILAVNIIMLIYNKDIKKIIKYLMILASFVLIIFTGSRGSLIGLVISFVLYICIYSKYSFFKKIIIGIITLIFTYVLLNYLNSINFFRLYQGSNGRSEMISYSFEMIKKSPIFGYGYSNIGHYLLSNGFRNVSTHNSFVDYCFAFGVVPTILFVSLIVKSFFNGIKNKSKPEYIVSLTFMIFNMNTILYNFGGVGISSLIFTLVLGFISISTKEIIKYEN